MSGLGLMAKIFALILRIFLTEIKENKKRDFLHFSEVKFQKNIKK